MARCYSFRDSVYERVAEAKHVVQSPTSAWANLITINQSTGSFQTKCISFWDEAFFKNNVVNCLRKQMYSVISWRLFILKQKIITQGNDISFLIRRSGKKDIYREEALRIEQYNSMIPVWIQISINKYHSIWGKDHWWVRIEHSMVRMKLNGVQKLQIWVKFANCK